MGVEDYSVVFEDCFGCAFMKSHIILELSMYLRQSVNCTCLYGKHLKVSKGTALVNIGSHSQKSLLKPKSPPKKITNKKQWKSWPHLMTKTPNLCQNPTRRKVCKFCRMGTRDTFLKPKFVQKYKRKILLNFHLSGPNG